jgi:bifunctional UDP-N-acetylglucosamine pyrophosphorylase / glucosamine-1-phosphate N-acetyltransferase
MKNSAANSPGRKLCAIVPAAGRGTRLGAEAPKVFMPLSPTATIWNVLHDALAPLADRIVLVLSPEGRAYTEKNRAAFPAESFEKTEIVLQPEPLGMGDAIFGSSDHWRDSDDVLIVWGDQVNLSPKTLASCLALHASQAGPHLTLPVVRQANPYVEYVFTDDRLVQVRQSREGDTCTPNGFSDVGVFLLSGGEALLAEWQRYRAATAGGSVTGEVNFLPFLSHLSVVARWPVNRYETNDPAEAVGINTPEELALARELWRKKGGPIS